MAKLSVTSSADRSTKSLSKHIVGLDAVRVFACLAVVAVHSGLAMWAKGNNPQGVPTHAFDFMQPYVAFGWVGVQIFFVLSGFVIAYSAHASQPGHFMTQRFARLMPALVLCTTFTGGIFLLFHQYGPRHLARMWFHSVTFYPRTDLMDGSHWTLSLEMSFYVLVFLVLLCKRAKLLSKVLAVLGIVSAFMDVCLLIRRHLSPQISLCVIASFQKLPYNQGHFIRHGCYFSLGVFLWLTLFRGATWQRIAMLAITFIGGASEIIQRARELTEQCMVPISGVAPLLVWIAALVAIFLCTRYNSELQQKLGLRGIAILRNLGLMTYPLYLIHQGFGKVMILYLQPRLGNLLAFSLTLSIIFALSFALAVYIEPPLQKVMRSTIPHLSPAALFPNFRTSAALQWDRVLKARVEWRVERHKSEIA